jgi:hypothetical protein
LLRAIKYRAIDLIEAAMGEGHARGLLVATHEGVGRLLGAPLDLMESATAEQVFPSTELIDPLALLGESTPQPSFPDYSALCPG